MPVGLFYALDGKCSDDYVARVEPSAKGGEKMAELILAVLDQSDGVVTEGDAYPLQATPPSYMADRS